ncbi:hypothetical protein HID58_062563 [Brassica napus]|uniref:Uncharacterized protein n=1 Tax=Brassica napus TaxID=3708 RepID=A0ABQ8A1T8_BRANA|nr:hypothetical protein HID58_062563 [Brassica napus]
MLKNYTARLIGIVGDSKAMEINGNALISQFVYLTCVQELYDLGFLNFFLERQWVFADPNDHQMANLLGTREQRLSLIQAET